MKLGSRRVLVMLLIAAGAATAAGCGRKTRAGRHSAAVTPAAPVPTPDNTPIPVLQTPAGLVLKLEDPTPNAQTTPTATPGAASVSATRVP